VNRGPLAHVDCTLADKDDTRVLVIVADAVSALILRNRNPRGGATRRRREGGDGETRAAKRGAYNNTTDYLEIERSRGRQDMIPRRVT